MRRILICAILAALPASTERAPASDIFVNNVAGDDGANGAQRTARTEGVGPLASLRRALQLAGPGDRILLENTGRPYRESVTLMASRHSGSALQPFILDGNGATLDGSRPVPPDAWEHYRGAMFRFAPPHVAYQQFFLNDRPLSRVAATPGAKEPPKLEPLQWCLHRGYIYFAVEAGKLPPDYLLSYAHDPVGITLYRVQNVTIRNMIVQGFQLDGINALNSVRNAQLVHLTCRGNGRAGIAVGGASTAGVQSCLVGNNGFAQVLTLPISETRVEGSELLANTAPAWGDRGGQLFIDGKPAADKPNAAP